jgi:AraC-like DNA-binding protein
MIETYTKQGIYDFVISSSGNAALAAAMYIKKHNQADKKQKIKQVQLFGKSFVEIVLVGDTFDDAYASAVQFAIEQKMDFIAASFIRSRKNVEEISALVGFANRQSFYAAFYKNVGETPNGYRRKFMEKNK